MTFVLETCKEQRTKKARRARPFELRVFPFRKGEDKEARGGRLFVHLARITWDLLFSCDTAMIIPRVSRRGENTRTWTAATTLALIVDVKGEMICEAPGGDIGRV